MRSTLRALSKKAYINPRVTEAQYAVRGLIPMTADKIKGQLDQGTNDYPFKALIYCNIGNPQALQQQPLTYYRQVMALVDAPMLLENSTIAAQFPADVVQRAKEYLKLIDGKTGAYTDSTGYKWARQAVADFIGRRDGTAAPDASDVVLTDGASSGVRLVMQLLIAGAGDGVLIPIPQYPLYTAQIALLGGTAATYYLDESQRWGLHVKDLEKCTSDLAAKNAKARLLVVINPGNPTGQVMTRETMEGVVRYCHDNDVLLLADEVYQENIYGDDREFVSFRKVVLGMPAPYNATPCVSLHSTSKGIIGECGRRGGYFEMLNVAAEQREQLLKLCSINLCSNVNGQVMTALMCTPPAESGASYKQFRAEYDGIFASLKGRAVALAKELNEIDGITCNAVEGAMYAFPQIRLPAKYLKRNDELNAAAGTKIAADARWALELLEATGIVVVPGSGFLQQEGTLHFRTTILPPAEQMQRMTKAIRDFQATINTKFA